MSLETRTVHWPACRNVRDLGGLPTTGGGRVRHRALVRADDLGRLTAEGIGLLQDYGIRRVVDLRSRAEVAARPTPFGPADGYRWAPFIDEEADKLRDPVKESTTRATYLGSVVRNIGTIAVGVAAIADAPPGGVVVHCNAGKDRTGMLVALVLRAAGVAIDDIAADYALTAESMRAEYAAELAAHADPEARRALRDLRSSDPETIIAVLELVERRYGGVPAYLAAGGLTAAQLDALRCRLLD